MAARPAQPAHALLLLLPGPARLDRRGPGPGRESWNRGEPQAAAPASWTQLSPSRGRPPPGTPPPGSVSKPRGKACLPPATGTGVAAGQLVPTSLPRLVLPHPPPRGPQGGSRASAGGGSPARPGPTGGNRACRALWELLGQLQPRNGSEPPRHFLSHLLPRHLLFPASERLARLPDSPADMGDYLPPGRQASGQSSCGQRRGAWPPKDSLPGRRCAASVSPGVKARPHPTGRGPASGKELQCMEPGTIWPRTMRTRVFVG